MLHSSSACQCGLRFSHYSSRDLLPRAVNSYKISQPITGSRHSCIQMSRTSVSQWYSESDMSNQFQTSIVGKRYTNPQKFDLLQTIMRKFSAPINVAFAYGSGALKQNGYDASGPKPMIDFMFAVDDPEQFHRENIQEHSHHYSSLRYLGPKIVSAIQQNIGTGVYFNPYVKIDDVPIKYGVVSTKLLFEDLSRWESLYIAGRLHKPVVLLRTSPEFDKAYIRNIESALLAALLSLPEKFTERELYKCIATFSYQGDVRMLVGENKNKVQNIVDAQMVQFRDLYWPVMKRIPNFVLPSCDPWSDDPTELSQRMDVRPRKAALLRLPLNIRNKIYIDYCQREDIPFHFLKNNLLSGKPEYLDEDIINDKFLSENVSRAVAAIVRWPTISQTFKGIFTAGPQRSIEYALAKIGKWRNSGTAES